MDMSSENDEHRIMEGWLYLIRSNKFGFQYSRKRYYVLQNHDLKSFCSVSHSLHKVKRSLLFLFDTRSEPLCCPWTRLACHELLLGPVRSAVVNSCICVMDNGRKNIRGKVFFIFTLSGISSTSGCLKLGARNPEEAARWVEAFQKLSLKMNQNPEDILDCDKYEQQHSRSNNSGRVHDTNSVDYHLSLASITDPKTADLSSYWTIFGCHNGLRLFKEARNQEHQKKRNGYPALAAMSVIDGAPEAIFQILMSFGSSRSEWDFCFQKGSVIEIIDGHTDIVHKLLSDDWLPRGMKRRDLLLQRCWRREDNGTYTILYHSVLNKKCPPQKSYIRACLKSGGYVISPVYQSKQSVVRHMLDIDWKLWNSYLQKSSAQSLSVHMLGRLAALREFFKTNLRNYLSEFSLQEPKRKDLLHQSETSMRIAAQRNENGDSKEDAECTLLEVSSDRLGLVEMDDESDEYFDLPEPFVDDQSESSCAAGFPPEIYSQALVDTCYDKSCTPPSNILMNKLNEYTVHRKGCANLEEMAWENGVSCNYILTLPKDPTGNLPNSWSVPEPSLFQIRGETYFQNRKKITAKSTLMQTVAVDWLRSDKREDHLAARPGSIVQNFAADGRPEFFFIVNFQVPGSTTYNVASYYMTSTPVKDLPLLEKFIEGDDAFRNSRFKLLPHITKGPWILKQSASRASLVGHMLKVNYIRGKNYIEIDIDVGSSTLARGLATTALSCFSNLISETAFVIQANTPDELPEHLYGASRLNHLDVSRAFWTNP